VPRRSALETVGRSAPRGARQPTRAHQRRRHRSPTALSAPSVRGHRFVYLYPDPRDRHRDRPPPGAVPLTPRHASGLVASWESEGRGRDGFALYYTGRQVLDDDPYRCVSRTYLVVGLLAERRLGPARVFLNLKNLTNVRQTRHAPLVRPSRAPDGSWTTNAWGPLDGRVVNGGVRIRLSNGRQTPSGRAMNRAEPT
jgi:hypothetical protein